MHSPQPPRDYPTNVVRATERIVADWVRGGRTGDVGAISPATGLLYYHYVDRGDRRLARELVEVVVGAPRGPRQQRRGDFQLFDTLHAFHVALWDGEAATAQAALARVPRRAFIKTNSFGYGARAARLLAEGRLREAIAEAHRAEQRLVRFGLRHGADRAERIWLQELVGRAEAMLAEPASVAAVRRPVSATLVPATAPAGAHSRAGVVAD